MQGVRISTNVVHSGLAPVADSVDRDPFPRHADTLATARMFSKLSGCFRSRSLSAGGLQARVEEGGVKNRTDGIRV